MTKDEYELRRWMEEQLDYNDSFCGEEINEAQLERLNRMKKMCCEIAELEHGIEAPFEPFDNTCCDGMAQLLFPTVKVIRNEKVRKMLSTLTEEADEVVASAANGDGILYSFIIFGMWDKFHHEGYDEE